MVSPPVRTKRLYPPKDFALRIESFSKLAKASTGENEKYEPIVFSAEGYSRKLQLYPNGNRKGNGRDHISLYLAVVNFPSSQDIYVDFKFFIFDQFNNDYLTIHDGTVKRFHRMKKEWGYDQLLESKVFTDPANGYLVNDSCEFGVEILIVRNYTTERRQTIEMVTPSDLPPFRWTVSSFSTRGNASYIDPPVTFAEKTCSSFTLEEKELRGKILYQYF